MAKRPLNRTRNKSGVVQSQGTGLGTQKLVAFVATRDPDRAKAFYRDTLDLNLVTEDQFALVFEVAGTMLRVTAVHEIAPAKYTVLGWQVSDIVGVAKRLQHRGVSFEHYPGMQQDEIGVWNSPSGAKVAWFKDPDGNTLSITQF
jgi:catechol 2,3-dioxygenase-like lactoylglutathione lyase family enzyme